MGVFTFGFAALLAVHYYPKTFASITTWHFGVPAGIFCGWLATVLLYVILVIVMGQADTLAYSFLFLRSALIGTLYGLVGACYMLLTDSNKKSEPSDPANDYPSGSRS